jgi:hypothetical protein
LVVSFVKGGHRVRSLLRIRDTPAIGGLTDRLW